MKRAFLLFGIFIAGVLLGLTLGWILPRWKNSLRAPGAVSADEVVLNLTATIDGSDRFIFTRDNVWNEHGKWQPPQEVSFNGAPWED
jgi:hypothetical protein